MFYKIFDWVIDTIAWVKIVASPVLFFLTVGAIIYFYEPSDFRIILLIILTLIGLILGVLWANKIRNSKEGTMGFMSRIEGSPDVKDKHE